MTDHETAQRPSDGNTRPALDPYFCVAAAGIAWITSAYRVGPSSLWDGDYRVVQCLLNQSIGTEGIVTAALSRSVRWLPVGTDVTRLGLLSAASIAVASWLCYRLCFWALQTRHGGGTIEGWLSFGTALLFSQSPSAQLAASAPPGPLPAVALVLASVYVALTRSEPNRGVLSSLSTSYGLGLLVAATTLERFWAGVFAAVLVGFIHWTSQLRDTRQHLREGCLGITACLVAVGLPWFLTRRQAVSSALAAVVEQPRGTPSFRVIWPQLKGNPLLEDLGPFLLVVSAVGVLGLLLDSRRRERVWLLLFVLPHLFLDTLGFDGDLAAGLSLFSVLGLLVLSALGLRKVIQWAGRGRTSGTALACSLSVIVQTTLTFAHADEAAYRADRYRSLGMEVFTDEALASLPARAVLLLHDPRLYRRATAAQLTDGLRPDLLVVSIAAATNRVVVSELLQREPLLAPVLRELAINGRPSEFALSTLADERPVFLEFDVHWDPRLREHLLPLPFLSRLYSQALGRSDRASVLEQSQQQLARVFRATVESDTAETGPAIVAPMEQVTRSVLRRRVEEQLTLLLSMGDRQTFDALFADYEDFEPKSVWTKQLRARLSRGNKSVDAFDLLNPAPTEDKHDGASTAN